VTPIARFWEGPAWRRYTAATGFTLFVIFSRLALDPWWGLHQNRHLVFLPTVMLSAWLAGVGPGLVSAGLCTVAIDYFWTEPRYVFLHPSFELFLFLLIAAATCRLIGSLHAARARADAVKTSREQLLAIVAHDLRNPLTTIKTTVTLLRRKPDELVRRLGAIERAVDRLDNLIRDLVDSTRAERGELDVIIREENVASIVHDIVDLFAPLARDNGIALDAEAPQLGALVRCDRDRLLQVLGNLLGNALKFTPEGGRITLRVAERQDEVLFEVSDTGPGIKAEHLPHIFERYWYADRRGTGLGLFIAQSILRAHGSRLAVTSEPGLGATFFFALARSPAMANAADQQLSTG
jgi:signal transduction histidine kinase